MTNSHNETKMKAQDGVYSACKDSRNRIIVTKYAS